MLQSTHAGTPAYLQLGEGVLLRNTDLDAIILAEDPGAALETAMQAEGCLIGAVREGCVFRCVPEMIDLTRGKRTPAAGEILHGPWRVTLAGTLAEISPRNALTLLNTLLYTQTTGCIQLVPTPSPVPAGPDKVLWIGTTGSGMLAIELQNPVSTGGMAFRAGRRGLGETPFTLTATKSDPADPGLPCRLAWLKGGASA